MFFSPITTKFDHMIFKNYYFFFIISPSFEIFFELQTFLIYYFIKLDGWIVRMFVYAFGRDNDLDKKHCLKLFD